MSRSNNVLLVGISLLAVFIFVPKLTESAWLPTPAQLAEHRYQQGPDLPKSCSAPSLAQVDQLTRAAGDIGLYIAVTTTGSSMFKQEPGDLLKKLRSNVESSYEAAPNRLSVLILLDAQGSSCYVTLAVAGDGAQLRAFPTIEYAGTRAEIIENLKGLVTNAKEQTVSQVVADTRLAKNFRGLIFSLIVAAITVIVVAILATSCQARLQRMSKLNQAKADFSSLRSTWAKEIADLEIAVSNLELQFKIDPSLEGSDEYLQLNLLLETAKEWFSEVSKAAEQPGSLTASQYEQLTTELRGFQFSTLPQRYKPLASTNSNLVSDKIFHEYGLALHAKLDKASHLLE